MKYLGIFLLVSFIGIAGFGIFGLHMDMSDHNNGCIAANTQGIDCPKQSNPLDYLAFHLDAFKSFSTATFGENPSTSLLALVLLVAAMGLGILLGNLTPTQSNPVYSRHRQREFFSSPPKQRLIRWLALHENSPTIFGTQM